MPILPSVHEVRGPVGGEDKQVKAGVGVPIGSFTGHLLSSDDKVALIPTIAGNEECRSDEKDYATEIMQGSYMSVSLNGASSVEVPIVAADLPKGGVWIVCYCANHLGCDEFADFTTPAGVLTVHGASGHGERSRSQLLSKQVQKTLAIVLAVRFWL